MTSPPSRWLNTILVMLLASLGVCRAATPASGPGASTGQLVNDLCPVLPEELASPAHELIFRGVPDRFCCRECKERFIQNPAAYLPRLPHVPPGDPVTRTRPQARPD